MKTIAAGILSLLRSYWACCPVYTLSLARATLWSELSCHSIAAPLTNLAFDFPKPLAHTHTHTDARTQRRTRIESFWPVQNMTIATTTPAQCTAHSSNWTLIRSTQRKRVLRGGRSTNPHPTVDADLCSSSSSSLWCVVCLMSCHTSSQLVASSSSCRNSQCALSLPKCPGY